MYFVYILQSLKDYRTYIGYTTNLKQRLQTHNKGQVVATRNRMPLKLIYLEKCGAKDRAKKREIYWKSGAGRKKLKQFFSRGFPPIQIIFE